MKSKPSKRQKTGKWFNHDCKTIRKDLRKMDIKKPHPNNPALRVSYSEALNKYIYPKNPALCVSFFKTLSKHNWKQKTKIQRKELTWGHKKSSWPKQFWDLWNNFNHEDSEPQPLTIQIGNTCMQKHAPKVCMWLSWTHYKWRKSLEEKRKNNQMKSPWLCNYNEKAVHPDQFSLAKTSQWSRQH